jgi:flavin-dependent thymidylate synthase
MGRWSDELGDLVADREPDLDHHPADIGRSLIRDQGVEEAIMTVHIDLGPYRVCPTCGDGPNALSAKDCPDAFHGTKSREVVRAADAAQYAREPIPTADRGVIRVRLLNATPDPLGSVAALCEQYKGHVIRSLAEVTDEQRRACLSDMASTVLNGPLEAAQFHFQIEGVTRSITHQMVRSRASFFAQESLRFAVPEGDWADEIPLPPSLASAPEEEQAYLKESWVTRFPSKLMLMKDVWDDAMINAQTAYERLIEMGMPAEEARGVLPHDMPTRIHWVLDLRTLLTEAGKRTCTQAQFPWRLIFAGMASALRQRGEGELGGELYRRGDQQVLDGWQFAEIADRLRPVCYQTGSCGFMAQFDRSCNIRSRVDAFAAAGVPSPQWSTARNADGLIEDADGAPLQPINDAEWAATPGAARS